LNPEALGSYKIIYSKLDHPERTDSGLVGNTAAEDAVPAPAVGGWISRVATPSARTARTAPLRIRVIGSEEAVDH
jgi:hypothetical protein